MRTDVLAYHDFYRTPLGARAATAIAARLGEAWGDGKGLTMAAYGYSEPYLEGFTGARARLALSPAAQGVIRWPALTANSATLVNEAEWPLPDASVDRVILTHGLEEAVNPQRLLREIWRVMVDDGRLIIVAPHRRGIWSMVDSTPFAAGRPYLKRQLGRLLQGSMFRAKAWSSALHFPPINTCLLYTSDAADE